MDASSPATTFTLASFARRYGKLDHDTFVAQFACPFLVENAHANLAPLETGPLSFRTEHVDSVETASRALRADDRELWPIRKRASGAFASYIGVGRTPNLDICIARPGVSKFHAYFAEREGIFQVTDKESTNGTFVNGDRITPGRPMSLRDNVKLEFANHPFTFMSATRLYRLLQCVPT